MFPRVDAEARGRFNGVMILEYNGIRPQIDPSAFVAPTAVIIGNVVLGPNSSVWYGAVLRGDLNRIVVSEGSNVQDNCVIHCNRKHETYIGRNVTVGHAAVLEGCRIEDGVLIGMKAVVLDGVTIGADSFLAAGTVMREGDTVPPRTLVAGIPGKPKRPVTDEDISRMQTGIRSYINLAAEHRAIR